MNTKIEELVTLKAVISYAFTVACQEGGLVTEAVLEKADADFRQLFSELKGMYGRDALINVVKEGVKQRDKRAEYEKYRADYIRERRAI